MANQLPPSTDRDALPRLDVAAKTQKAPGAGPVELAQIAGFGYVADTADTEDTAVAGLIRWGPNGANAQSTLTVAWNSGDWKLASSPARPPGGRWPVCTANFTILTGTVSWGVQ